MVAVDWLSMSGDVSTVLLSGFESCFVVEDISGVIFVSSSLFSVEDKDGFATFSATF